MMTSTLNLNKRNWAIPIAFSLLGLFYLLNTVISKVTEVLDMGMAREVFLPISRLVFAFVYSLLGVRSLPDQLSQ
jgi:hypothetical protein